MSKVTTLTHLTNGVVNLVNYVNGLFVPMAEAIEELQTAIDENSSSGSLDFDNKLSWPGCTFTTTPKDETTGETIQTIADTASGTLKAKKITLDSGNYNFTETYIFYAEDGVTEIEKYTVQTSRDASTLVWSEVVTKII